MGSLTVNCNSGRSGWVVHREIFSFVLPLQLVRFTGEESPYEEFQGLGASGFGVPVLLLYSLLFLNSIPLYEYTVAVNPFFLLVDI